MSDYLAKEAAEDERNQILAPYRAWNPREDDVLDAFRIGNFSGGKSDFFLLNGPAGSGKSHVMRIMCKVLNCVRVHPAEVLYESMVTNELPDTKGRTYEEFKALPYGRERLIAASEGVKQKLHRNIWGLAAVWYSRAVNPDGELLTVIESNGFGYEADFFEACAHRVAGVRFATRRDQSYCTGFVPVGLDDMGRWVGDSREPVMRPYMYPYYTSQQFIESALHPHGNDKIHLVEVYRK